jgi:DNA polymerase-1
MGSPIFDTMVAAHLLQPDLYKGLARAAPLYLDLQSWKHKSEDAPEEYNAKDVFFTWKLAEAEEVHLQETGQARLFHETMMPALPVLIRMTERGIKVDRTRLAAWQKELSAEQTRLLEEWNGRVPGVNPNSPSQISRWLYKDNGLPVHRAKGGKPTTDESALKAIAGRVGAGALGDAIRTLLAFKKVAKLKGTYSEVELGSDGCVHPHYLPAGKESDSGAAATGRLASSGPNIQNQPQEARALYTAHSSELALLECDYSQIELRIAAELANDHALQEALKGDVHAATQARVGCDRVRAKNLLYGSLYGAGPRKLALLLRTRGVATSEAECKALQLALAAAYPRLWAWRQEVVAVGTSERHLTNPFGRRRYFYGGSTAAPQMIDYLPQSTAADIVWDRLVPLDAFCTAHGGAILATVHDSFLMEFPKEAVDTCLLGGLREVLESEFPQIASGFRVPVDMKIGSSWGQMEPLPPQLAFST